MASERIRRGLAVSLLAMAAAFVAGTAIAVGAEPAAPADEWPALRVVVMDPLCDRLACDCVAGYARRNYARLAEFLTQRLGRNVEIGYAESLSLPQARLDLGVDLVIGKFSEVRSDAAAIHLAVRTVAVLTGKDGKLTQTGLFVVRHEDPAQRIADLRGYRILFGPEDAEEKRAAGLAALEAFDLPRPDPVPASSSCSTAALAVAEKEADAAVISSYAMPLLEGCGTIDKGALRIVGRTDPVPFIGVFATDRVGPELEARLSTALRDVARQPALVAALESRDGFVILPDIRGNAHGSALSWPDWRGPRRDALSADVPASLPKTKRLLWSHTMTGSGMSGLAVAEGRVIAADKSLDEDVDIFRCLDADTGRLIWSLRYPAAGEMDFTNSPRANPVICDGRVYLLGAFGDLHCARLESGEVLWKTNLVKDFGARLPTWGTCAPPLVVDDKVIVAPGANDAALVALDRKTGAVIWKIPGDPPGYGSFVLAELGGVRQIVGYDIISLGGWDPQTGKRLWRLMPELEGDFNVPTPIVLGHKLLVSTENNGTRIYRFEESGKIVPEPVALNEDLAPDTSTPVVLDGLVFGSCGRLMCLDARDGLKTLWETDEEHFADYCSLIAGNGRVLAMTQSGELCLLRAARNGPQLIGRLALFDDVPATERDVWSHPALLGNRLYVRNLLAVYCFVLD